MKLGRVGMISYVFFPAAVGMYTIGYNSSRGIDVSSVLYRQREEEQREC